MKIIIAAGNGHMGRILTRYFVDKGDEVVVLARKFSPETAGKYRTVAWDGRHLGSWASELEAADVLINLAGRSVNCRYHAENRGEIIDSRVLATQVLGEAMQRCKVPPRIWLQASTATIYCHRFNAPNDDVDGVLGGHEPNVPETWNFSIDVATRWEKAANEQAAKLPNVRMVLMRTSILMSPDPGGAFEKLMLLVRLGLGGSNGGGRQFISWMHESDFVRSIQWLIDHPELRGPVILAAPNPLPNRDFMRALREAAGVTIGLPSFRWMLEIGAVFLQTETELILKSRRVVPTLLTKSGFTFQFPTWPEAAKDLVREEMKRSREGSK